VGGGRVDDRAQLEVDLHVLVASQTAVAAAVDVTPAAAVPAVPGGSR